MSQRNSQGRAPSLPDPTIEVEPDQVADSVETPTEDALEQSLDAVTEDGEPLRVREVPLDADPADLADQAREVLDDEDEYR